MKQTNKLFATLNLKKLWEKFNPSVVVTKPVSDLLVCLACQQNTYKLLLLQAAILKARTRRNAWAVANSIA